MVVNIVIVTKKAVILVFNPKISKIPPRASVKPADHAKNSGIKVKGIPNCLTNSTNQSDTSKNPSPADFGVQGVPNLLTAKTNASKYPVITLGINIRTLGNNASTLNGIINFLMGCSWWYIGLSIGYLNLLKFK
jgi:hypothetical protein